eukprot:TRINITY_DN123817_c0_g1_i1.p1 TRINITY_DN123817_c0_g1~~TRINITY_DN123817_c0_g1_i1.p1  ORF type:complete len:738 (+),score=146.46 TRINITY_DN123817_c0_g1_i1:62-2275(+)
MHGSPEPARAICWTPQELAQSQSPVRSRGSTGNGWTAAEARRSSKEFFLATTPEPSREHSRENPLKQRFARLSLPAGEYGGSSSSSCVPASVVYAANKEATAVDVKSVRKKLYGLLHETPSWPLQWDQVLPLAKRLAAKLAFDNELVHILQVELALLAPRYRPFSAHGGKRGLAARVARDAAEGGGVATGDSSAQDDRFLEAWSRSPGALQRCRATGLQPEDFVSLIAQALKRGGRPLLSATGNGSGKRASAAASAATTAPAAVRMGGPGGGEVIGLIGASGPEVSSSAESSCGTSTDGGEAAIPGAAGQRWWLQPTRSDQGNAGCGRFLGASGGVDVTDRYRLLGKTLRIGKLGVVRLCQLRNDGIPPEPSCEQLSLPASSRGASKCSIGGAGDFPGSSAASIAGIPGVASRGGGAGSASSSRATDRQLFCIRSVGRELVELAHKGQQGNRLSDDVALLRSLDNPHVARLVDAVEDKTHLHFVFPRVEGVDLYGALKAAGICTDSASSSGGHGISEAWIGALAWQMALALAYCHWRRVVHRNVTLRKVMLQGWSAWGPYYGSAAVPAPLPQVVLLDTGLAEMLMPTLNTGSHRNASEDSADGGAAAPRRGSPSERPYGTPLFMAPEVFHGDYGPGCDVWSLGVIAFVLLTGRFPFEAAGGDTLVLEELITSNARPAVFPAHVSEEAMAFCTELLRKDDLCRPRAAEAAEAAWLTGSSKRRLTVFVRDLYVNVVAQC